MLTDFPMEQNLKMGVGVGDEISTEMIEADFSISGTQDFHD